MNPPLRLYLFDAFRLERGAQPVRLPTRKVEALLAYLALHPEAHNREKLAALFWGDTPDEQARGSLRKALAFLRQAIGPDAVLADRQTVQLHPNLPLWVDAMAFWQAAAGRRSQGGIDDRGASPELRAALELYGGDLLSSWYDDWIEPLRERYRALYLDTLLRLTQDLRAQSAYDAAIAMAQRVLAVDPANERAHQHLMFCYLASGDRSAALRQYEACARLLAAELDAPPSPETTALYRWLKQAPAERPGFAAAVTNLPLPATSFIGREAETAQVKAWLAAEPAGPGSQGLSFPRLVTLTGPGGSGKTRLAVQAATDLIDAFPDGVWWVELASLLAGAHVPHAVARTLGVREAPGQPLEAAVVAYLHSKRLLLAWDNCEHLVDACAAFAHDLLSRCAQIKILATSREALGLTGERVFPVPTLATPHQPPRSLAEFMMQFAAIRLFVERAQAVQPDFALTDANAPLVAQICQRLDGIPLAIELAATRVATLAVAEIAARLDDRFSLLTTGSRVAPPRHQTLAAVLDWSHDLLPQAERVLFRRLSVFAGGFTMEEVDFVCGGEEAGAHTLLDLLSRLVSKSLVLAEHLQDQRTRFRMLETIREYARHKLEASGEADRLRDRHLRCFVALAESAELALVGPQQRQWLDRFEQEIDNIRAALAWSLHRDVQQGLRLAGALVWFWNIRGHWQEGPAWLSRLLAVPAAQASTLARAKALVAAANLAHWGSNDYPTARAWLEQSITMYRQLPAPDPWGLGNALTLYGEVLAELRELGLAQSALEESLAIGEDLGDAGVWLRALNWMTLGGLAADPAQQQDRLEQSVMLFRQSGDEAMLPVALARLAWRYLGQGDLARAQSTAAESYALTEQIEDRMGLAWLGKLLGDLASAQSDYVQAAARYETSLAQFRTLGSKLGMAAALADLGQVRLAQGDAEAARAHWQEAQALLGEIAQHGARARVLSSLAELALAQQDATLAAAHYAEVKQIYQEMGHEQDAMRVQAKLAEIQARISR